MRIRLAIITVITAAAACSRPAPAGVTRETRGDTTIIRTSTAGAWGPMQDAVEVHRVGSDGSEVAFGQVNSGVILPQGRVLVFDAKALNGPVLELFDSGGRLIGTVGRSGSGQGEYGVRAVASLAARGDGTIYLLDPANNRVNRYTSDGLSLPAIPIQHVASGGSPDGLKVAEDGSVYVLGQIINPAPANARPADVNGYIHYDSTGRVLDTIPPQGTWFKTAPALPTDPHDQWTLFPTGSVLVTRDDRVGFLIKGAASSTKREILLSELTVEAPKLLPEERSEIQAMYDYWRSQAPPEAVNGSLVPPPRVVIPEHKPAIRAVMTDLDSHIWLQRNAPSVKVTPRAAPDAPNLQLSYDQPTVWSAFRADGAYLGDVRFPMNTRVLGFDGNIAWAIVRDDAGRQMLVKYRMPGVTTK